MLTFCVENFKRMEKKEEKRKRQTKFQRECRTPGMNCFVVDNSTWLVPPKWEGEPQCHCTSASNSTYSCMRSLGQQQGSKNSMYCEFFENLTNDNEIENEANYFYEYYDMHNDPYQLNNIYQQLDYKSKQRLRGHLQDLSKCKGKYCHCKKSVNAVSDCDEKLPGLRTRSK